jgi:hypothetical protein
MRPGASKNTSRAARGDLPVRIWPSVPITCVPKCTKDALFSSCVGNVGPKGRSFVRGLRSRAGSQGRVASRPRLLTYRIPRRRYPGPSVPVPTAPSSEGTVGSLQTRMLYCHRSHRHHETRSSLGTGGGRGSRSWASPIRLPPGSPLDLLLPFDLGVVRAYAATSSRLPGFARSRG